MGFGMPCVAMISGATLKYTEQTNVRIKEEHVQANMTAGYVNGVF